MACLKRHARLLYILALFQLLGGPVILCGVLMLARLSADPEVSMSDKISLSIQQMQTMDVAADVGSPDSLSDADLPSSQKAPKPAKTKEAKGKLFAFADWTTTRFHPHAVPSSTYASWQDLTPERRGLPPPLPPPRA